MPPKSSRRRKKKLPSAHTDTHGADRTPTNTAARTANIPVAAAADHAASNDTGNSSTAPVTSCENQNYEHVHSSNVYDNEDVKREDTAVVQRKLSWSPSVQQKQAGQNLPQHQDSHTEAVHCSDRYRPYNNSAVHPDVVGYGSSVVANRADVGYGRNSGVPRGYSTASKSTTRAAVPPPSMDYSQTWSPMPHGDRRGVMRSKPSHVNYRRHYQSSQSFENSLVASSENIWKSEHTLHGTPLAHVGDEQYYHYNSASPSDHFNYGPHSDSFNYASPSNHCYIAPSDLQYHSEHVTRPNPVPPRRRALAYNTMAGRRPRQDGFNGQPSAHMAASNSAPNFATGRAVPTPIIPLRRVPPCPGVTSSHASAPGAGSRLGSAPGSGTVFGSGTKPYPGYRLESSLGGVGQPPDEMSKCHGRGRLYEHSQEFRGGYAARHHEPIREECSRQRCSSQLFTPGEGTAACVNTGFANGYNNNLNSVIERGSSTAVVRDCSDANNISNTNIQKTKSVAPGGPRRGGRGRGHFRRLPATRTVEAPQQERTADCPLCVDVICGPDLYFFPCPCGYQLCFWCLHRIRSRLDGRCPNCRQVYEDENFRLPPDNAETQEKVDISHADDNKMRSSYRRGVERQGPEDRAGGRGGVYRQTSARRGRPSTAPVQLYGSGTVKKNYNAPPQWPRGSHTSQRPRQ